jgi:ligand-binding SRPBCC domain-containing protein
MVEPHTEGALFRDQIDYEAPLGFLGRAVAPMLIPGRLKKLFDYRHEVTRAICEGK